MLLPFEASFGDVEANLDDYVEGIVDGLRSEFMAMPKGPGFIEYAVFEDGYEALKRATRDFRVLNPAEVFQVVKEVPIAFLVLRTMLGFTPPEWAYVATERTGTTITQNAARSLDRKIRMNPLAPRTERPTSITMVRLEALVTAACQLLVEGSPETPQVLIHRLDKADTKSGLRSIQPLADLGVPYPILLYERFLGRPFAGHRDSVSELVGDVVEAAIEAVLSQEKISYRKTKRAARVEGFDQAPDFIVPNEFNPKVVIEAKLAEDDGTARDKVTRVQHLGALSMAGVAPWGEPRFQVIACIAGRGFRVRREDIKKLILATRGKVFTLQHVNQLVQCTELKNFVTNIPSDT